MSIRLSLLAVALVLASGAMPARGAEAPAAPTAGAYLAEGQRLYASRDYLKAQTYFSYATKLAPRDARAWKGLGYCLAAQRQAAKALSYLDYALRLDPSDAALGQYVNSLRRSLQSPAAAPLSGLAQAAQLYKAQRYQEAAAAYQRETLAQPGNAAAWQGLGNCRYALKDKAGALQAYEQALKLNPGNQALAGFANTLRAGLPAGAQAGGRDWVAPLWRSAILPGWGQWYNGQHLKGGLMMAGYLALTGLTIYAYEAADKASKDYAALGSGATQADFDAAYSSWESSANLNHYAYIGSGLLYSWSLIDAVVQAKAPGSTALLPEEAPRFALLPGPRGLSARWTLARF